MTRERKGMNENKIENSDEKLSNINLKNVNEKASDLQNHAICIKIVDNTTVKNVKCNQYFHIIHFTHTSRNVGNKL